MMSRNVTLSWAMLLAAMIALAGCEAAPDNDDASAPSGNEQEALAKAQAMIEENRDRLDSDGTASDETAGDETAGDETTGDEIGSKE